MDEDDELEEDEYVENYLTEEDIVKLNQAKALIESTDFWNANGGIVAHDYDYCLNMSVHYIDETLNGTWWK